MVQWQIQLSRLTTDQVAELQRLGRQTFYETFAWGNTPENMQHYLDTTFSEDALADEITCPDSGIYIARNGIQSVGYMKINRGLAMGEFREENCLEIERLYVLKEFQGRSVGQLLLNKAIEVARICSVAFIWLGVWEKNERAIRFYEKNGFVPVGSHIYRVGIDEQTDLLMKLRIL